MIDFSRNVEHFVHLKHIGPICQVTSKPILHTYDFFPTIINALPNHSGSVLHRCSAFKVFNKSCKPNIERTSTTISNYSVSVVFSRARTEIIFIIYKSGCYYYSRAAYFRCVYVCVCVFVFNRLPQKLTWASCHAGVFNNVYTDFIFPLIFPNLDLLLHHKSMINDFHVHTTYTPCQCGAGE